MAYNGPLASSNISSAYMDLATAWKLEGEFLYAATPLSSQYRNPPGTTYFERAVKRATWFTQIPTLLRFCNGTPQFGQQFSVSIGRIGDYLLNAWLRVTLPSVTLLPTNLYTTDGRIRWCRKVMHNLIEDCSITVNETSIARLDNYTLDLLSQFMTPAGKQDGYDEMIGDTVDLTGSFGPTTALGATIPSKTCNLPLPFFFSRDSGVSLPTSALLFNELKINFKLRDWDKLLILDNSGAAGAGTVARAVPVVGRDIATTPVISSISCWSNQALVSEFERSRMACTVRDIVIENHQSAARLQYSPISSPNFIAEPKFIFAVRALFMAVRNTTFENEWSNYTTNSPYNSGSIINYKPSTTTAPIQDVTLNYDSTTRLSEMGWDYFSHINPYYSTNVIPREIGYGVYSYALDLASIDPNGSTNFSKIGNVAIQIRPSQQALTAAAGSGAATTGSDFPQKYTWINFVLSNQVIRIADGQLTFPYV